MFDDNSENENALREARSRIDELDNKLLGLLVMRAKLSVQIGKLKSGTVHRPVRENAILDRLCALNKNSFMSDEQVCRLWKEIFAVSKELQSNN